MAMASISSSAYFEISSSVLESTSCTDAAPVSFPLFLRQGGLVVDDWLRDGGYDVLAAGPVLRFECFEHLGRDDGGVEGSC